MVVFFVGFEVTYKGEKVKINERYQNDRKTSALPDFGVMKQIEKNALLSRPGGFGRSFEGGAKSTCNCELKDKNWKDVKKW